MPVFLKCLYCFLHQENGKSIQLDPLGSASTYSIRGVKHIPDFKKRPDPEVFLKHPVLFPTPIKPHYRSEGPRQVSCGVFGGVFILSLLLILILLWSTYLPELVLIF